MHIHFHRSFSLSVADKHANLARRANWFLQFSLSARFRLRPIRSWMRSQGSSPPPANCLSTIDFGLETQTPSCKLQVCDNYGHKRGKLGGEWRMIWYAALGKAALRTRLGLWKFVNILHREALCSMATPTRARLKRQKKSALLKTVYGSKTLELEWHKPSRAYLKSKSCHRARKPWPRQKLA